VFILGGEMSKMDYRVKRIYGMMLDREYRIADTSRKQISELELEILIDLKNAEIRWIRE
jgi:hypothetical protein